MSDWNTLKLPECLENTDSVFKIPKKSFLDEGQYPIVSQEKGLVNGYWNKVDDLVRVEKPLVVFGDHTQILKHIDFDFVVGADGVKLLQPRSFLDSKYLYYFLMGNPVKKLGYARHYRLLKELDVRFPSSPEQKSIVAILDEAFAGIDTAIANTEKNLTNTRELFESYLNSVFTKRGEGWIEEKLKDICNIKHGFAFKSEFFVDKSDYILLTPGSFYENGGFRDQGKKTKYYKGEIPDGYLLNKGNFLIAMTEQAVGLLGSSLIVPEKNRYLHNQRLGLVQPFEKAAWCNDFFFHQFNTHQFRDAVQASASGVKVRHTSPTKLGDISVCFPPSIDEQKNSADKLNSLLEDTKKLEALYQNKHSSLQELKKSLLQKAFTGELTAEDDKLMEEAVA